MLKRYFQHLWDNAEKQYEYNIIQLLEKGGKFLDCGCADGSKTVKIAQKMGADSVYGIEIVPESVEQAERNGIKIYRDDLNRKFSIPDKSMDAVYANQVIEHLYDTDNFIEEIYRILKPNGYAIICTENLSSWHNIFSLLFGWQPFSITNISYKISGIGNPLALHRKDKNECPSSYLHMRVIAYLGLREIFELHGFKVEKILGAGYYPFPAYLANLMCAIDPRHAAFLTLKLRKCN